MLTPPAFRQTAGHAFVEGLLETGQGEAKGKGGRQTDRLEYKSDYNAAIREGAKVSSQQTRQGLMEEVAFDLI